MPGAYHGPPPLDLARVFTEWQVDPAVALVVVVLGGWYLWAMRRVRASGQEWPVSRAVNFLGLGLGTAVLMTMSFIGVYDGVLFWVRSLQLIVLLMISPLFLANGMPLRLLAASLPAERRARVERALRGRVAMLLSFPPVGSVLLIATPWVYYFTPLFPAMLHHGWVDEACRVGILAIGFLYFWARLQADIMPREYPHVISLGITFAEAVFDGALGIIFIFGHPHLAAGYYDALHRTWGPDLSFDQSLGGFVLWMVGDMAGLPFLGALFIRMFRRDQGEAKKIDQELDAQLAGEKAARKAAAEAAGESFDDEGPDMMRPWWETDPILSKRYGTGEERA